MERFWSKVKKGDGCWEWTAAKDPGGYGAFKLNGRKVNAHVVAFALSGGFVPEGEEILHSCDNRACVNPAHLSSGTRKQNVLDMVQKGRHAGNSKLTADQVLEIRSLRADGVTRRVVAECFGISERHVQMIVSRGVWGHI